MLEQKVEAFLKRHHLSLKGKRLLIGVSGGPDSLTLLHYLWKKRDLWELEIIAVHVDHMFRGEQSWEEAIFVKETCRKMEVLFEWKQINVTAYMQETGKSPQIAARECRYQYFEEKMHQFQADYLVLGHHGDDQIETILMRMTRGSSGYARAGIPFKRPFARGEIIRPLLAVSRLEIENYCMIHKLDPRRDPSNEKPYYVRNRFRSDILPFLKKENPAVHEHFQRMSEELNQDEKFLEELTVSELNKVMRSRTDREISIEVDQFLAIPLPLQRRAIQLILNYLYRVRPSSLSALHIDLILKLLGQSNPSGQLDFPEGLRIIRSYQQCDFQFGEKKAGIFRYELFGPGNIHLPNGDSIHLEYVAQLPSTRGLDLCILNPQQIPFPLIIRTRAQGDRIHPKGMSGTKKIKDIFIDAKIPLARRETWPIVTDGEGNIVWAPKLKLSNLDVRGQHLESYLVLTYKSNDSSRGHLS
ncbi:tRNA lysidine(34) synthetase TilS [Pseudoneobacillus sp. C159]